MVCFDWFLVVTVNGVRHCPVAKSSFRVPGIYSNSICNPLLRETIDVFPIAVDVINKFPCPDLCSLHIYWQSGRRSAQAFEANTAANSTITVTLLMPQ